MQMKVLVPQDQNGFCLVSTELLVSCIRYDSTLRDGIILLMNVRIWVVLMLRVRVRAFTWGPINAWQYLRCL